MTDKLQIHALTCDVLVAAEGRPVSPVLWLRPAVRPGSSFVRTARNSGSTSVLHREGDSR